MCIRDRSSSVGSKTKSNDVRGFLTKTITMKNFKNVADIKQIRFWNWDKDPSADNADVTIPFDSMTAVSYTHLDVYKRQAKDLRRSLL